MQNLLLHVLRLQDKIIRKVFSSMLMSRFDATESICDLRCLLNTSVSVTYF